MSGRLPTSGLPTIAPPGASMEQLQQGATLIVDTTPCVDEPCAKKMRCELSSNASSSSPLTPSTPGGGCVVRIKSMSRPSPAAVAAASQPSPAVSCSRQSSEQHPHTPGLSKPPSFGASPNASQGHSPPSITIGPKQPLNSASPVASSACGSIHAPELVARWTSALTRAILRHWPKEQEAAVTVVMGRIASRIPGIPSVAAGQARVLVTAFQDPKNGKLRDEVMGDIIDIERLVRMNEQELTNPELQREREVGFLERNKSKDWSELKKAMSGGSSDMFRCPRCGVRDAMWEQRQTRSADEPMTIICSCNKCSFYWRIRG